jgi:hypothetical protein
MSQEAQSIFIALPTADDPHKQVNLQDAVALLVCEIQDIKTHLADLDRWSSLTSELATAVEKMQRMFDSLAKQLSGTSAVAKAIFSRTRPSGVN